MLLRRLILQNFRTYAKKNFSFDPRFTVIVGPNASGKSNLVEAIGFLSTGKSFRTSKEKQVIAFGTTVARIEGEIFENDEEEKVGIVVAVSPQDMLQKRYFINGVSKHRGSLSGLLPAVIFTPLDLDIVSGQPGAKRRFLDDVLEQTDEQYAHALTMYAKALRQRNALLESVQKSGWRDEERFNYWDNVLIANGHVVTKKREAYITYINELVKKLFSFTLVYDKSVMSRERLLQYKEGEVGAGMTLVGPQRDDIIIQSLHPVSKQPEDVKYFCSRGQQRLITLELKKAQIAYLQQELSVKPLLVLDDIFSELDGSHIQHVLEMANEFQTIITTTHEEFIKGSLLNNVNIVKLVK